MTAHEPTPIVDRPALLRRLERHHRARRHVLVHGPPGVGKSVLIAAFMQSHPMLPAPRCNSLGSLLAALEPAAGLVRGRLKLAARVHRLASRLPETGRTVAIDHATRMPPRVAHLIRALAFRQPVWVVARSPRAAELGHLWPYLFLFHRLEVPPFTLAETRTYLSRIDFPGDRDRLVSSARALHRLSAGHPATLAALANELRARPAVLQSAPALERLTVHARITRIEQTLAGSRPTASFIRARAMATDHPERFRLPGNHRLRHAR